MSYTSQHCFDKTMDSKMALLGYIAHGVFRIVQMMMNKVTFVGFKGAIAPLDPPRHKDGSIGTLSFSVKKTKLSVQDSWQFNDCTYFVYILIATQTRFTNSMRCSEARGPVWVFVPLVKFLSKAVLSHLVLGR